MPDIDIKFDNIFKIAVTCLRINGSYPFNIRNKRWFILVSFVLAFNVICFFLLCYSVLVHDIKKGNFTDACKNTAMIIICMNTMNKYVLLLINQKSIMSLIHTLDSDYEMAKQLSEDEQDVVNRYAQKGRLVGMFWFICASSGGTMFPLKAFLSTTYSFWHGENQLVPMFDLTFPDTIERNKDSLYIYCGVFALCFVFAVLATLMYIGFDPFIPIFTLHTCGQLDLLSGRVRTSLLTAATEGEMEENLKEIIIHLQKQYSFIERVQNNFQVLNEFNMKTTTIVLPLIAFHVTEELRYKKFNYEFFILFVGATLHFLMPCYFSDVLMERSNEFRQAIYSSGWEKYPNKRIRQTVLFMLTRATRPLSISTVFYNISLDTFSMMVRDAYSIFNLMNAAWSQ